MSGYIGNIPVPQATQTRQSFTATASQTTFNTAGYSVGYVDVFLNGVKLAPADYTATNGSDIILAVGAASGDILEIVAYEIFQVVDQDFTGDFTVDGTTFVVDSTNNRVGIGTSSPPALLSLEEETSNTTTRFDIARLTAKSSGATGVGFGSNILFVGERTNGTLQAMGRIGFGASTNTSTNLSSDFIVETASSGSPAERMRIDSSGNLLVGKTVVNNDDNGLLVQPNGNSWFTATGDYPLGINRKTSDGALITFTKDQATVGSIGVTSSRLYIGNGDAGLRFLGDSDLITPWNPSTNSNSDNLLSLGNTANRIKDIYVGGGVYLGGTGAANKLDDYEEGTFTPTLKTSGTQFTSVTYTFQDGHYTKIGREVVVHIALTVTAVSGGTGALYIGNLPFSIVGRGGGSVGYMSGLNYDSATYSEIGIYTPSGGTDLKFTLSGDNVAAIEVPIGNFTSSFDTIVSFTYRTS